MVVTTAADVEDVTVEWTAAVLLQSLHQEKFVQAALINMLNNQLFAQSNVAILIISFITHVIIHVHNVDNNVGNKRYY